MIDGITSEPFSMTTFPLPQVEAKEEIIQKVRQQSRQRWATPRDRVEKAIEYWTKKTFSLSEKAVELAQKEAQKQKEAQASKKEVSPQSQKVSEESQKTTPEVKTAEQPQDLEKYVGKWFDGIVKLKFNYGVFVIIP